MYWYTAKHCQLLILQWTVCVIQVHLIDASFVWTEPHSKRIKVKLVVQKEVIFRLLIIVKTKLTTVSHYYSGSRAVMCP